MFSKEDQDRYIEKGLDKIIPLKVALRIKEVITREYNSEDYICQVVYDKTNYSKKRSYKGAGARIGGAYRFLTKNKKAFNNLILAISDGRIKAPYLWNKTTGHIWLSNFEAYCLISEYKNAFWNCYSTSLESFNKPIGYYQHYSLIS